MADYLEAYAARFELPVRTACAVDAARAGRRPVRRRRRRAALRGRPRGRRHGAYPEAVGSRPFAAELDPRIVSSIRATTATRRSCGRAACWSSAPATRAPRSRSRCRASHPTWLSGERTPARSRSASRAGRARLPSRCCPFVCPPHVLTVRHADRPQGAARSRAARRRRSSASRPRTSPRPASSRPADAGVRDGLPAARGRPVARRRERDLVHRASRQDFSWIDLPVFGSDGEPSPRARRRRGRAGPLLRRPASSSTPSPPRRSRRGPRRRAVAEHIAGRRAGRWRPGPRPRRGQPSVAGVASRASSTTPGGTMATKPIPEGYHTLTAYLSCR